VPVPGRYEADSRSALRGSLASSPWIWPSREYLVYVPRGHARWRRVPLLVLIHGCRQKAEDIAEGTRITELADELGCLVLLPRQNSARERMGLLELVRLGERERLGRDRDRRRASARGAPQVPDRSERVFVAGMFRRRWACRRTWGEAAELVAGVFIHSGVACGAASSGLAALKVLKHGADTDVAAIARDARARRHHDRCSTALAVQGADDDVVAPVMPRSSSGNICVERPPGSRCRAPSTSFLSRSGEHGDARRFARRDDERMARCRSRRRAHVLVDGLGHAGSGGDDRHPYNDPRAPDATALFGAFLQRAMQ